MKNLVRPIFLFSFLVLFGNGFSQASEVIGFACGYDGAKSEVVYRVEQLYQDGKIDSIVRLLEVGSSAERFLAVIICENIETPLSEQTKRVIDKAYRSTDLVKVCFGCICHDTVALYILLNSMDVCSTREMADYWVEDLLK